MELPDNEVHVWYFNVDDFVKDIDRYRSLLSEKEIVKSNKFKFNSDRILNIMARSALRLLSSAYLDYAPNAIEFQYGTYGKPDYRLTTDLKFNVTHSGKIVALAFVRNSEIGVDVERIKTNFDVLNITENFFSLEEIKMLRQVPKKDVYRSFYRCWTRKESFIKAKGSGLNFPLASFSVSLNTEMPELLKTEWNPEETKQWRLFSFEPITDYVGALSVHSHIQKVKYANWPGKNFDSFTI